MMFWSGLSRNSTRTALEALARRKAGQASATPSKPPDTQGKPSTVARAVSPAPKGRT